MPVNKRNTDGMSDTDIRENFSDLFSRMNRIEIDNGTSSERDRHIIQGIADIKESFRIHDEKEMLKYDKIIAQIGSIKKYFWLFVGGVIVLETLHKLDLIKFNI